MNILSRLIYCTKYRKNAAVSLIVVHSFPHYFSVPRGKGNSIFDVFVLVVNRDEYVRKKILDSCVVRGTSQTDGESHSFIY